MEIPESVAPDESLGRGISSSRIARRARRPNFQVPINVFLPPRGETDISVDRLGVAPHDAAVTIADTRDSARDRTFYGWAVLTAEVATGNGREVAASPIPCVNPYHADITLPEEATHDREEQKRHAQELADASFWNDRSIPLINRKLTTEN